MVDVAANFRVIQERVAEAARKSGRVADQITIVGAAKQVEPARVNEAIAAGLGVVGENYIQEARAKVPHLQGPVTLHFIGRLQTNKAKQAVELFSMVQCVDRLSLGQELAKRARAAGRALDVLLEVNLAGEQTKSGVSPEGLVPLAEQLAPLDSLRVCGLMAMPPFAEDPEASRPYFRRLRQLREELEAAGIPGISPRELSMGMSSDYPVAIEEGATIVRIGTALFGPRR